MSIHVLQGKPGAGKSYDAVQRCRDAVESGRSVVTNLPLKRDHPFWVAAEEEGRLVRMPGPAEVAGGQFEAHFGNWAGWEHMFREGGPYHRKVVDEKTGEEQVLGPLVVVDEASGTFSPMVRASKGRNATEDYHKLLRAFEVHRHHGLDILLIYQDHAQATSEIKALVERWHTFTNITEGAGIPSWSMRTTMKGFQPGGQALNTQKGRFKKEIFALYDSHSEGLGKGESVKIKRKGLRATKAIWLRPSFIITAICLVVLPVLLIGTWENIESVSTGAELAENTTFGASAAARPTEGEAQPRPVSQAPVRESAEVAVTALEFDENGVPLPGSPIMGFGRDTLFFAGGVALDARQLLSAGGWEVMQAEPCRVVIRKQYPKPEQVRVYPCTRGY